MRRALTLPAEEPDGGSVGSEHRARHAEVRRELDRGDVDRAAEVACCQRRGRQRDEAGVRRRDVGPERPGQHEQRPDVERVEDFGRERRRSGAVLAVRPGRVGVGAPGERSVALDARELREDVEVRRAEVVQLHAPDAEVVGDKEAPVRANGPGELALELVRRAERAHPHRRERALVRGENEEVDDRQADEGGNPPAPGESGADEEEPHRGAGDHRGDREVRRHPRHRPRPERLLAEGVGDRLAADGDGGNKGEDHAGDGERRVPLPHGAPRGRLRGPSSAAARSRGRGTRRPSRRRGPSRPARREGGRGSADGSRP